MTVLTIAVYLSLSLCITSATWSEPTSYYQNGDVIIAGMFPLHFSIHREDDYSLQSEPTVPVCTNYFFRGFRWMQALLFAIDEINNSTDLLNGINLGWKLFDTCDTTSRAVTQAMTIARDHAGNTTSGVNVVVGPTSSDNSVAVANILGVFDIPQISYGSTSRTLSDKVNYNSFLRTIPNDNEQATAIADLLAYYNWTWVGAIAGDDEYGRPGITKFKEEAGNRGICVEFVEYISKGMKDHEIHEVAEKIQNFNATVFVLFSSGGHLTRLVAKLKELGVRDKIWVASEAWATSRKMLETGGSIMHGTLGITTRGGPMKGFREFLESVSPSTQPTNPFITEFWEKTFHCACMSDVCTAPKASRKKREIEVTTSLPPCTGDEDFSSVPDNPYLQWTESELEKSYTAYLAVYAIAHALQNIRSCINGSGLMKDGKCPDISTLEPWQLLSYLKQVEFQSPGLDEMFGFDSNGDPNATYKLVSWVPVPNGTSKDDVEFVHVGNYSKKKSNPWSLNTGAIFWHDGNGTQTSEIPISICSYPCEPGFYRVKLASDCCHKCIPCPIGEYSNYTNADVCNKCHITEMANENRTHCVPKPEDYMKWDDAYGITFACLSTLGVALTLFTAGIFFWKRQTPIVKATNVEISFLLFLSLIFCFATPFIYIEKPQDWTCRGRQISFILSFTFCVASILVKTLRVLTAFQTTMPLNFRKRSRWLGEHLQILVVLLVALVQVAICVTWLVVDPPDVKVDYDIDTGIQQNYPRVTETDPFDRILVVCDPGSLALMICSQAYLAILALIAFILAFRARKLPENFNEAKFITFSMLIFFIVWLSFIPAYLSTTGVMKTAVYCIGILASTFGILGCIFFPKLYIILISPERNTTERVRMNTVTHAFRSASRSVIYQINTQKQSNGTDSTSADSRLRTELDSTISKSRSTPYTPSPCLSRAKRATCDDSKKRTPASKWRSAVKKNKEYSIEINGKMTSSVTSPARKNSGKEKEQVKSRFDVTLQVNIAPDSEETSSEVETPKSEDKMLSETDEQSTDEHEVKHNKKKNYQRIPLSETSDTGSRNSLKKSESFNFFAKHIQSDVINDNTTNKLNVYHHTRSSSA
ncbi:extracellular calcium-sensing receptor-like isoform X3 [Styela clava]